MTITLTKPETAVVWRSATAGAKTTSIPGSVPLNNGYELVIKTTKNNGDTHTITPTSGTVGGLSSFQMLDAGGSAHFLSDAANSDWVTVCLCTNTVPITTPPGCTWFWTSQTNAPGPFEWYAATISDDGTAMAAFEASNTAIVVTTNSGATWTDVTPAGLTVGNPFVSALAADRTGQKLLVAGGRLQNLYLSGNAGGSWTTITLSDTITGQGQNYNFSVAMSADGSKMIAGASTRGLVGEPNPTYVWVSLNGGGTWVQQAALATSGSDTGWSVQMARDGSAFTAINGPRAFISLNGSSWTAMTNPFSPDSFHPTMGITANAGVLIAAHQFATDYIMKSIDQGATWNPITTLPQGIYGGNDIGATISMSLNGQTIAVGSQFSNIPVVSGPLFISCDGGVTWAGTFTGSAPSGAWNTIFVTGAGDRVAVATQGPTDKFPYSAVRV